MDFIKFDFDKELWTGNTRFFTKRVTLNPGEESKVLLLPKDFIFQDISIISSITEGVTLYVTNNDVEKIMKDETYFINWASFEDIDSLFLNNSISLIYFSNNNLTETSIIDVAIRTYRS